MSTYSSDPPTRPGQADPILRPTHHSPKTSFLQLPNLPVLQPQMDDYFMVRRHVPAFGSWATGEYLPFTECFESARQDGLLPYTYQENDLNISSGDFCVTGDLYQNDVITPAMILFPRNRSKSMRPVADVKQTKLKKADKWEPIYAHRQNVHQPMVGSPVRFSKPVDEDLYKISPDQLQKNAKKKRGLGFFASCCFASN